MTEWNVYIVGDLAFMQHVFNGVAMLLNSGSLAAIFKIAALLGVIGMVFGSALTGGRTIGFHQMAVCLVAYLLFFQVTARVNIENVQTGEYRAVDNVPAGLAATASIISTVGYEITKKMEQAFTVPSMTENGALDPLFTMASLYDQLKSPINWYDDNRGGTNPTGDLEASIASYMRHCVSAVLLTGAKSYSQLFSSSKGVDELKSPDTFQRIPINDGLGLSGDPFEAKRGISLYNCPTSYDKIKDLVAKNGRRLDNRFVSILNEKGEKCNDAACTGSDKIQDVMQFYGLSSMGVRDFQLTMMMYPYLRMLPAQIEKDYFQGISAVNRQQFVSQQSFQWAASGTSFLHWMKDFMAIFQGLIFALTPFVAFLIGLGLFGLRMAMKYILVIIWTQTWMPLAAVLNMYLLVTLQDHMHRLIGGGTAISFQNLYNLLFETQQSIGLAGNLYSMIPALGGFIVWGSAVAFNSLATSAAATSPASTKVLAPDVASPPPIMQMDPRVHQSNTAGMTLAGAPEIIPSVSVGETVQAMRNSALSQYNAAKAVTSATASKAVNSIFGSGHTTGHGTTVNDGSSTDYRDTRSSDSGSDLNQAHNASIIGETSATGSRRDQLDLTAGAFVSANANVGTGSDNNNGANAGKKNSANASIGATGTAQLGRTFSTSYSNTSRQSTGTSSADRKTAGTTDTKAANLAKSLSQNHDELSRYIDENRINTAEARAFQDAYATEKAAQKKYDETMSATSGMDLSQKMTAAQIAQRFVDPATGKVNGAFLSDVAMPFSQLSQQAKNSAEREADRLQNLGMNKEQAHIYAQWNAVRQNGRPEDKAKAFADVFGDGAASAAYINPDAHKGVGTSFGEVNSGLDSIRGGVNRDSALIEADTKARQSETDNRLTGAIKAIEDKYDQEKALVGAAADVDKNHLQEKIASDYYNEIEQLGLHNGGLSERLRNDKIVRYYNGTDAGDRIMDNLKKYPEYQAGLNQLIHRNPDIDRGYAETVAMMYSAESHDILEGRGVAYGLASVKLREMAGVSENFANGLEQIVRDASRGDSGGQSLNILADTGRNIHSKNSN